MGRRFITIQPSDRTDQITEDGDELTQRPYPFHVTEDGLILRQDFWRGHPLAVVGFARRVDRHVIDLNWEDARSDPQRAVGMYLVTRDVEDNWHTQLGAISEVTVSEDENGPAPE